MIDTRVAHTARVWNYWLGGKDNYLVEQEVGEQIRCLMPDIIDIARASRGFLVRAVRHLAGEAGVCQFLDIGAGLPTTTTTHEVAQAITPACRVVYVDNDPVVLAHARALLTSTPEGSTDHIHADLRDPDAIWRGAARTLDFTQPVALMLMDILNFIIETDQAHAIVNQLLDTLPAGSYLLLSHPTTDIHPEEMLEYLRLWNEHGTPPMTARSSQELTCFFNQLELLEPGVISCPLWRPDPSHIGTPVKVDAFCGVGRKPTSPVGTSIMHHAGSARMPSTQASPSNACSKSHSRVTTSSMSLKQVSQRIWGDRPPTG